MGIEYDGDLGEGVDVLDWHLCADGLENPNAGPGGEWPASGGGNVITWLTCQDERLGNDGMHGGCTPFPVQATTWGRIKNRY